MNDVLEEYISWQRCVAAQIASQEYAIGKLQTTIQALENRIDAQQDNFEALEDRISAQQDNFEAFCNTNNLARPPEDITPPWSTT